MCGAVALRGGAAMGLRGWVASPIRPPMHPRTRKADASWIRGSEDGAAPWITLGRGGPGGDSPRYCADTGPKSPGLHIWPQGGQGHPAGAALRNVSIRAPSAGWRPQHHAHDEQDEEESHDERERPHVSWMCRLHDAPPPSLSNRIPGRFVASIDARDGLLVPPRRLAPRWRRATSRWRRATSRWRGPTSRWRVSLGADRPPPVAWNRSAGRDGPENGEGLGTSITGSGNPHRRAR